MNNALRRFQETAKDYSDIYAVVTDKEATRYQQLAQTAYSLGAWLEQRKAKKVAILLPQSADAYAAMFGTWMAGAEYCPVNVDIPQPKIDKILHAYKPDVILHASELSAKAAYSANTTTASIKQIPVVKYVDTTFNTSPDAIAYTIFTSGSTGHPKGVQIQHSALAHYLQWVEHAFPLQPGLRWSQHPNIGFDLSVLDIFGALCFGATLYPLQSSFDRMFPARFIKRHKLQVWNSTPSVVDLMSAAGDCSADNFETLQHINFCGEPLTSNTLDSIFAAKPDITVINTYGPTEATVSCTELALTSMTYKQFCRQSVCFGKMIDGMGYIIDADSSSDASGELLLYGSQLSCGYLNRDDLTQQKFVSRTINGKPTTCYRTGDIVEEYDGQLYFKARQDDIVKISGKLIDLSGIEQYIRNKLQLECYLACKNGQLYLFVNTKQDIDLESTRKKLSKFLEPHEMPVYCKRINAVPKSANDKLDRTQLLSQV